MKLTLIGNGIMAQSLARGLVKNYEGEEDYAHGNCL